VKSTNLRNKPVDKRRLSKEDRESYRPSGRASALSKARQRKGQMAWDNKVTRGTQEQKPGTGGFTKGLAAQQDRNRAEGAKVQRSKELRSEKPVY
tara:strand:+ start:367 stop:651 length:285 start_codon:yes stop_codon:yes gene_type:complete